MLQRKLLTRIGLLIAAFVCGAIVAIYLLQGALADIDQTNADAAVLIDGAQSVSGAVTTIQVARDHLADSSVEVSAAVDRLERGMKSIGAHRAVQAESTPQGVAYAKLSAMLGEYLSLNTDPTRVSSAEAIELGEEVQAAVQNLGETLRRYVASEQAALGRSFRILVLGLTLAALVMVNVAVLVLLRTAQVVLKPVAALVEGSRELAAERFDHRVVVDQDDEFGELAHAYNHLAAELKANEERKAEALRQLAVTLNHDLNNAMSVIELQLGLLDRRAGANPTLALHLNEIRSHLAQMSNTVASLKNIRRVVLTEYVPGQKMLDLPASVQPAPVPEHAA